MTVSSSTSRAGPYAGAGQTGPFVVTYRFLEDSHLRVTRTTLGVETVLSLSTDYTVLGAGSLSGGVVSLSIPLPVGSTLTIDRSVPITQETDYTQSDSFPAESHEDALDKLTMIAQQQQQGLNQAIRVPESATALPLLPVAASRANRILGFDSSGNPTALTPVAGSAASVLTDLANNVSPTLGAGLVGFNYSLSYGVGTIGAWLRDLALAAGSTFVGWVQSGTGATTRTVSAKLRETVSVKDFGAVGDGVTNDHAAFAAAWAAIKSIGGTILIPPGTYLLNTQWNCDVDSSLPFNYSIIGYGAQLLAGAAVTGHAMRVYGGYNNFGVKIEGLHFNHRNNTTVGGCIQGLGAANLRIIKCSMEAHNTTALYSAIDLGPITVGVGDTNCFWTLIDGFTTRQRSGGDGTLANIGVQLRGAANATKIVNCSFGGVISAVRFNTDGTAAGLANGVVIDRNDFEGVTAAITINTASPATAMPTGLRITNNRVEVATAFINISGALVTDPSNPLIAAYNYLVPGSVTNYMLNPNNQLVFLDEPAQSGTGTLPNIYGGNRSTQVQCEGTGYNFQITRIGGGAGAWNQAHLVLCGYHLWVESATGKLRLKSSAPTSDSDGTVVGTQT